MATANFGVHSFGSRFHRARRIFLKIARLNGNAALHRQARHAFAIGDECYNALHGLRDVDGRGQLQAAFMRNVHGPRKWPAAR